MTDVQIESIIKFGILIVGASTPLTVGLIKYFGVQKEKIIQNAYGPKKMAEVEEVTRGLTRAVEELRGMVKTQISKFDELIEKIVEKGIGKL